MHPITSGQLKLAVSLKRRRFRESNRRTIVEGVRSVKSLLASDVRVDFIVTGSEFDRNLIDIPTGLSVVTATSRQLARISDVVNSQGVIAIAETKLSEIDEVRTCTRVVALDGVSDPGNVGTILRTAAWFGFGAVVVGPETADPFNPKVVRASMGGVWELDIVDSDDLARDLLKLHTFGHAVVGADLNGTSLPDWTPPRQGVLVVGSEAHGLSRAVRKVAGEFVSIPALSGGLIVESLNASVAAGIVMERWALS